MSRSMPIKTHFLQSFRNYTLEWGGFGVKKQKNRILNHRIHYYEYTGVFVLMAEVSGFCLKCKTYGPIKDGKMIVMSNGRTRCAGFCSQNGCTGKISKIVS